MDSHLQPQHQDREWKFECRFTLITPEPGREWELRHRFTPATPAMMNESLDIDLHLPPQSQVGNGNLGIDSKHLQHQHWIGKGS